MKYLCLIYYDEKREEAMSASEWEALVGDCLAHGERLRENGQLLAGEALQSVRTATTLRVRDGRMSITDGPFAETTEQLAGFCLLDARDLNDAIQIAGRMPPARLGCVEVRPIRETAQKPIS